LDRQEQKQIRCAVYTRQSIDHGDGGNFSSCDAQREACEAFVLSMKYEGWVLIERRFDDVGQSGKDLQRPALMALVEQVARGKVDQIVVHRFDRLTRSLHDWAKLNEYLKDYSVSLSIVTGGMEATGSAFTEFVTNILATFGQFERDIIRERMEDARNYRSSKGVRFAGKPPIGYDSDPSTRQLAVNEDEAALVRRFFEKASEGQSAEVIARSVNAEGHRTKTHRKEGGKLWTGRTVLQVIRNPVYLGKRQHKGQWIAGVHEPLVSKGLADEARRQIARRRSRRPGRRDSAKNDPFVLRGILRCGRCDRPMTTSSSRVKSKTDGKVKVHRYYRCRGNAEGPPCKPSVQVAAHIVEGQVVWLLANPWKIVPAPRKVKRLLSKFSDEWEVLFPTERAAKIRELVWSATWNPSQRNISIVIDEINLERIVAADHQRA